VQLVIHAIDPREVGRLALATGAVWLTLIAVRFGFETLLIGIIRVLDRRPSQIERRMSFRSWVVSSIAGFRGAVSLAIALSVPRTLDNGDALPGRQDIVFITAGVIVLTLLVQGPLLPGVVRWARLPADTREEEIRLAERTLAEAALAAIEELDDAVAAEHGISSDIRDGLSDEYRVRLELVQARAQESEHPPEIASAHRAGKRMRLIILARKREVLLQLRHSGTIDDGVARLVQTRLDIEEQRLTGIEPKDGPPPRPGRAVAAPARRKRTPTGRSFTPRRAR
jgi:NhaP-type Na+/H+ and K+/H+ antiporter